MAIRIAELQQALDDVRIIEEHLVPIFWRELEQRRTVKPQPGNEAAQSKSGAGRWWKLGVTEDGEGTEERDERWLKDVERSMQLLQRVDIPRRRELNHLVDMAGWSLAGIRKDLAKANGWLLHLRESDWHEPAVFFSSSMSSPTSFTPLWVMSWPDFIHRLPGGDAVLGLLFGTIDYAFPAVYPIYERLERGCAAAEERIRQAREREVEFEQTGTG